MDEYRVRGFRSGARGSRNAGDSVLHVMLHAYCDDSSDRKRDAYFACGAAVAHETWWARLEPEWAEATKELTEPFRSTDCETQQGQFREWDKPDCDALMAQLVGLLIEYSIGGFASVVPMPDFQAVFPVLDKKDAYLLAVEHTMLNMAHLAANHGHDVQFWVEQGTARPGQLVRGYERLRDLESYKNRSRFQGFSVADKWLAPLQAADLLAREAYKHMANIGVRPTRKPAERMIKQIAFLRWDRETLEHIRERGWPDNPAALACWEETDKHPTNHQIEQGETANYGNA